MVDYIDSVYKFTDPIRYFKENDPYYWEVDNIPLKQLQENVLWLKDQLQLIPEGEGAVGVNRSDINELKPYLDETGTIVKVKPGRFIARINDSYNQKPLQKLLALSGVELTLQKYNVATDLTSTILAQFRSNLSASALSLNGLAERIISWDPRYHLLDTSNITYLNGNPGGTGDWPLSELNYIIKNFVPTVARDSHILAAEFVKQFRGVARTAVVDVPNTLSIEIPPFRESDYFYVTTTGQKVPISGANVRFDLLFVYSKPIDVSSTTINKWNSNNPTTLLSPTLGLIRGAGVGIAELDTNGNINQYREPLDSAGNTQIAAHVADENITTNGFTGLNLHGSFPSPEDLMNLAPVIQEKFESSDPRLIGQSILPIAYIAVRKNASIGVGGSPILTTNDIVDIRPFLRTTELTYSERAGICAASPSLSLANPVATKYNLEKTIQDFKEYVDPKFVTITNQAGGIKPIAAAGIIHGGGSEGPEKWLSSSEGGGATVPIGWDKSMARQANLIPANWANTRLEYVDAAQSGGYGNMVDNRSQKRPLQFIWRKEIEVTGITTSFSDYSVNVRWHNCYPQTAHGAWDGDSGDQAVDAAQCGVFVLRGPKTQNSIKFTIVAINSIFLSNADGGYQYPNSLSNSYLTGTLFETFFSASFLEPLSVNQFNSTGTKLAEPVKSCFHPSVAWEAILTTNPLYGNLNTAYSSDTGQTRVSSWV